MTHDQTRFIFETNTIGITDEVVNIDDIIETTNHFKCIDMVIDKAKTKKLSETFIKELHYTLKSGTSDNRKEEFECIHPFQDGNGRVGRLIMLKECLSNNIVPFIIDEELKWFYYRGLQEWDRTHNYLVDTCLTAQDKFKLILEYFKITF